MPGLYPALIPGFLYQQKPPRGAATEGKSECVSRQRLNANDFRMILAEDDTEKLGGYQEKIMPVSGARVIHCPSEAD